MGVHHPWRWVRERLPDWQVEFVPLPGDLVGETDARARCIRIDDSLDQAQRRSTVEHERIHARDGDVGPQPPWREAEVAQEAARNLIPLAQLVDACRWSLNLAELAEECWVDVDTMQCRLDHLTAGERAAVQDATAERNFHMEGATSEDDF